MLDTSCDNTVTDDAERDEDVPEDERGGDERWLKITRSEMVELQITNRKVQEDRRLKMRGRRRQATEDERSS